MCVDPITLGTGLTAAGTLMQGFSAYQTGKSNAAALETAAAQTMEKAKFDVEQADRRYRRQEGTVQAEIGKSGLDARSFTDVLADDARESALEKKAILTGAEINANNLRFQAAGQREQGKGALISSIFTAGGALVTGYGKAKQIEAVNAKPMTFGGVTLNNP